mgnify:CR=1 FL=1
MKNYGMEGIIFTDWVGGKDDLHSIVKDVMGDGFGLHPKIVRTGIAYLLLQWRNKVLYPYVQLSYKEIVQMILEADFPFSEKVMREVKEIAERNRIFDGNIFYLSHDENINSPVLWGLLSFVFAGKLVRTVKNEHGRWQSFYQDSRTVKSGKE